MVRRTLMTLLLGLIAAGAVLAQGDGSPAAARLKEASHLKRTSFKKPDEEKRRILLNTAAVYESVVAEFGACKPECAEASFRAGEIYRSLEMIDQASSSFARALEFDGHGEFAARSLNEIGHIHRRKKEWEKAIACYERVLAECPAVRDECADAVTWIGKVLLQMKERDKGRQTLLGFMERFPEFPVAAIRNVDLAVQSLIEEKRPEEAASVLAQYVRLFEASLGQDVERDRLVEKALRDMKSAERLSAEKERPRQAD